jgi:hypothetical protein
MKKEYLRFLCTSFMAVVCMSVNATIYNGNCGDSPDGDPATNAVTWSFNTETGVMTLTGNGDIKTFSNAGPMPYPWCDYDGSGNNKGMEDITTIVIGEGITNIPDYAFAMYEYCTSVSLPSTLTIIGNSALEECGFTSITLPEGLQVIDEYALLGSKFSSITLPSTLTTIGSSAFNDCESLTSITIPANVTSIGESAFQNCIALETVTMLRATLPTLGDLAFYDYHDVIIPALTAIYVPAANVAAYKAAAGWSNYAAKIEAIPGLTYDSGTYTFSRTGMTANAYSTICLPFNYEEPASCTFYEFTNVAKNGSGEWEATFTALAGYPTANTPYIFTNTGTSVNITKYTGAPVDYPEGTAKTTVGDWTFQATYSPITWTNIPKGYYGYAGQATATATAGQFVHLVNGASAAPFRAYLKCNNTSHELYKARTRGGDGDAQPQTIIVRLISASGEATNIGTIDTRTGEMNLDGEAWYSLDGRKLTAKPSKKGVYINNGKSVLVK